MLHYMCPSCKFYFVTSWLKLKLVISREKGTTTYATYEPNSYK